MLRFKFLAALTALSVINGGCIATQMVPVTSGMTDAEFAHYTGNGPCTVAGQAFLRTRGGDVRYGAGSAVTLIPDTSLLREVLRVNSTAGNRAQLDPAVQSQWTASLRTTRADGEGEFEFRNIPCGDWYAESTVTWEVPTSGYTTAVQGGLVAGFVSVTPESSPAKVMLTY